MLRGIAIFAGIICAVSTLFVLFPRTTPAWISPEQIVAAILFWPVIVISTGLAILGLCKIRSWKSDPFYLLLSIVSLVFPGTMGTTIVTRKIGHRMYVAEESRRSNWFSYGATLNPLIIEYIRQHPDRVTFPFNDDRATVTGLGEYLASRTSIPIKNSNIIDPWGESVLIIIDRDKDMKLRFEDNFYGVYNSRGNDVALSLFAQSMHSLAPHFNEQWQITDGVIPNK